MLQFDTSTVPSDPALFTDGIDIRIRENFVARLIEHVGEYHIFFSASKLSEKYT